MLQAERDDWNVSYELGDTWKNARKIKLKNSSLFKIDVLVYPEFSFKNVIITQIYQVLFDLSPAIEISLWKGMKATAQVKIPIYNDGYGAREGKVHPGFLTLSQRFRLPYNVFGKFSVGYFSGNRYGADVDFFRPFNDERFSLLARIGYTGAGRWDGFKFQYDPSLWRVTWSLGGNFYWPRFNTQFTLKAEQYLLKEKGIKFDMIRHFRYCSIGFYAMKAEHAKANGGFRFQVALPPYKYKRKGYVPRVNTSTNMGISYNAGNERYYYKEYKAEASDNIMEENSFNPYFIKLALATVALTSVMFTSCEKEEFNVAPVELDPASATIAITVYDLGDRSIITEGLNITGDTEVKAGADGKIAPETRKFTATKKDYLPGEGQAVIPALNKGQFAFVPVNIFLQKITDAAKDVYPTPDPETIKPEIGQVVDGGSYTNDSPESVVKELSYTAYVGQTVTNIDEVKTWIDANIPATKALSNEELKAVLKAAVEGLNTGFTAVVRTEEVTIAPYTTVTLKATTNYQTSVNNVSATVDGVVYNIPGVNIKVALNTTATQDIVSITHDHGHGHGNGNNAGGGNGDGTAY